MNKYELKIIFLKKIRKKLKINQLEEKLKILSKQPN